jgi:hypothetical protein
MVRVRVSISLHRKKIGRSKTVLRYTVFGLGLGLGFRLGLEDLVFLIIVKKNSQIFVDLLLAEKNGE